MPAAARGAGAPPDAAWASFTDGAFAPPRHGSISASGAKDTPAGCGRSCRQAAAWQVTVTAHGPRSPGEQRPRAAGGWRRGARPPGEGRAAGTGSSTRAAPTPGRRWATRPRAGSLGGPAAPGPLLAHHLDALRPSPSRCHTRQAGQRPAARDRRVPPPLERRAPAGALHLLPRRKMPGYLPEFEQFWRIF